MRALKSSFGRGADLGLAPPRRSTYTAGGAGRTLAVRNQRRDTARRQLRINFVARSSSGNLRSAPAITAFAVAPDRLRWRCDPEALDFGTTADVGPVQGVVGQDRAVESLEFGLETDAPGHNVFVRGLAGTGRMTLLRDLLERYRSCRETPPDRCYVHNFSAPERPRLITLPRGEGDEFRRRIDRLIDFIRKDVPQAIASEAVRARRAAIEDAAQAEIRAITEPFDQELRANHLTLITVPMGSVQRTMIAPLVKGEPVAASDLGRLQSQGGLGEGEVREIMDKINAYSRQFEEVSAKLLGIQSQLRDRLRGLLESEVRAILADAVAETRRAHPVGAVNVFLDEIIAEVVRWYAQARDDMEADLSRLGVNLVSAHSRDEPCPIVIEASPTLRNLLGTLGSVYSPGQPMVADHTLIRGGSILRADGGCLVLDARDLLSEPGAWKALVRTLRTGQLEIMPSELQWPWSGPLPQPEPIEIRVKVVLVGDPDIYYSLDALDADFPQQFKVLVDFDTTIARDDAGVHLYAGVLARIAADERLPAFDRGAVAAIAEHGARIAGRQDRLTARFGRLGDIAREAAFVAGKGDRSVVGAPDVLDAIRRGRSRADLPARKFRELLADGTIHVQTRGRTVGQVNGLAVTHAGPLTYGFPARITATIGPGSAGAINIEREANLSGAIHTKGFYILGGLLRALLKTNHPLAFSASIAFEQSYGGIDGDSASGAEACCLLSALTEVGLRQDIAMTGAIDQLGHLQPVGAVTEKIEGFFDACQDAGFTGNQGVIIPRANVRDLMLRQEVADACAREEFRVYAVATVAQALCVLSGREAGERDANGDYPEDSMLALAVTRAHAFWKLATGGEAKPA